MTPPRPLLVPFLTLALVAGCRRNSDNDNGGPAQSQTIPTVPMQQPPMQQPGNEMLAPPPPGSYDNTGAFTLAYLQMEARSVIAEVTASLEPAHQVRVQSIPLQFSSNLGEINAAAGCTRSGRSLMAITAGLLVVSSASAEAKAVDELANTQLVGAYQAEIARLARAEQPVHGLTPGSVPPALMFDPRKLARQKFLFDQQVAFILGHELAHHYRGHTGCAGGGNAVGNEANAEEVVRVVSNTLPMFNQPVEAEADAWGVTSVLDAGSRRVGGRWTEEGALLSMDFFAQMDNLRGNSPMLLFVRTHPPSALRRPIIQMWADRWRQGQRPTVGNNPLPLPVPIPIQGLNTTGGPANGNPNGQGNNAPIQLPFPLPFPTNNGQNNNGQNNGQGNNGQGGNTLPFPLPIPLPRGN